jgi:hypothetical protein
VVREFEVTGSVDVKILDGQRSLGIAVPQIRVIATGLSYVIQAKAGHLEVVED